MTASAKADRGRVGYGLYSLGDVIAAQALQWLLGVPWITYLFAILLTPASYCRRWVLVGAQVGPCLPWRNGPLNDSPCGLNYR